MSASRTRLQPGAKLGNYTVTRLLGEGGMGTVYEGIHEGLGKRVAIKTLHSDVAYSGEAVARFVREGKAAAMIRHPNVVDVADVGVHDGTPYLVMEYLQGVDLGSHMQKAPPMDVGAVADIMIPVASALSAAHAAGIVHRDLKPDNIVLTEGRSGIVPKLVDFGISKLRDGQSLELTGTNAILGTPYYMSPEQAGSSKQVDHRSDIFSLGVILYQCVTHELPFKGDSLYQLLGDILHGTPPPVCSLVGTVPPAFEAIIERALDKEPERRYPRVAEVGAALLPFASDRVRLNFESEFAGIQPSKPPPALPGEGKASTFSPTTRGSRMGSRRSGLWVLAGGAVLAAGLVIGSLLPEEAPPPIAIDQPLEALEPVVAPPVKPEPVTKPTPPEQVTEPTPAPEAQAESASAVIPDAGAAEAESDKRPQPRYKRPRVKPREKPVEHKAPAVAPPELSPEPPPPRPPVDLFRDRK